MFNLNKIFILILLLCPICVYSSELSFKPDKDIINHIQDSHKWNIIGDIDIYIPVIIYYNNNLTCFSSRKFYENPIYESNDLQYYQYCNFILKNEKIYSLDNIKSKKYLLIDFSITKNVISMFFSVLLLLLLFIKIAVEHNKYQYKVIKGINSYLEPLILFIINYIAKPNIGKKYIEYMPLLLNIFFFILLNNIIGIIPFFPGGNNVSGNISYAIVLGMISISQSLISSNKYYWKNIFSPNVPYIIYPILIPIELIGIVSKLLSLILRLFANISAGHIIIISLTSLIFIFKSILISPVSVLFLIFMYMLELIVAFMQAFIFTLLTALFIGETINNNHH